MCAIDVRFLNIVKIFIIVFYNRTLIVVSEFLFVGVRRKVKQNRLGPKIGSVFVVRDSTLSIGGLFMESPESAANMKSGISFD